MSGRARWLIFGIGAVALVLLTGCALARMPAFGGMTHLYRDAVVNAALARNTPNVVSSVNFDLRGLDTFGEEAILLASVLGAAALLRPAEDERRRRPPGAGRTLQATRAAGYVLLPVTLLVGADVVVHGHLTPGGGFQGGVVLATGLHLVYVAGSYPALRRVRPVRWYESGEALGMSTVTVLGLAGLALGAGFLGNVLPTGRFGELLSAGTVPIFSVAIGVTVASGVVVLLAQFLEQDLATRSRRERAS
ncbi:sodium:proton antiporter [Amycolatopsis sp. K13G38]|uniref:Sodium:proton antiporter n=1 Tax=Amycolatopsis acididurans TaxID=2724524 RepID=A0ABX1J3F9_9PSEU|nr:MnhB domain-containing protein [Amycolatopsis acididurans]NKQ54317.1 sodium:proton antiporter [Amycolatopsis acididurans]